VDISDAVSYGDVLYLDAVLEGDAEQVLPWLHHVNSLPRWPSRHLSGDGQPLADVDEIGVDDPVGGGKSRVRHAIMQGDAEQVLPWLHGVDSLA